MKRAEHQPTTELCIYAGIYCKTWTIADEGSLLPQHSHQHPHISFIVSGSVQVWCDRVGIATYHAPAMVKIPARTFHRFLTLTPDVVIACIHNADHIDADGEPVIEREHVIEMED